MSVELIAETVLAGGRLSGEAALELYVDAPTGLLGRLADTVRARKHPTPTGDLHHRPQRQLHERLRREMARSAPSTVPSGTPTATCSVSTSCSGKSTRPWRSGGCSCCSRAVTTRTCHSSGMRILFRSIKSRYPDFKLHALSPPELLHLSRLSQQPVPVVVERLVRAGLDSVPGGGAEILVDRVRRLLHCDSKATADEWLSVMGEVHRAGLRSTATMMYGSVERLEERVEHLCRLRDLQDETGGFTAFITWSYQPPNTELGGVEATGIEYLRTLALSRIVLDNFDNLQASWVTQGGKVGQLSLAFGANDMGSIMIEENVVRAAGAEYCMDESEIVRNIEDAGFVAKRRNMVYDVLGDPLFRDRVIPRRTELAVARRVGDTTEAAELARYPARSRSGKQRQQAADES